jgi:hypothetical protein
LIKFILPIPLARKMAVLHFKGIYKSQGSGELAPVQRRRSLPIPVKVLNLMVMEVPLIDLRL